MASSGESDEERGAPTGGKRRRRTAWSSPLSVEPSRRAFQKLWTDADEIAVLQGYREFTERRGTAATQQHDAGAFYDEILGRLDLDFTRSQLAEKLRRLKRKYRSVAGRVAAAEEGYVFRSPHEKAAFDIAGEIWASALKPRSCDLDGLKAVRGGALDAAEPNTDPRPRRRVKKGNEYVAAAPPTMSPAEMVEQTLRSCFPPLFNELLRLPGIGHGAAAAERPSGHLPLSLVAATATAPGEQWKKQQIMELEVYLKRVELVQEHIKTKLEELKSNVSS